MRIFRGDLVSADTVHLTTFVNGTFILNIKKPEDKRRRTLKVIQFPPKARHA